MANSKKFGMTPQEAKQAQVQEGIEVLNARFPEWIKNVNLGTLDMNSSDNNLLSQIYGETYSTPLLRKLLGSKKAKGFKNLLSGAKGDSIAWYAQSYGFCVAPDIKGDMQLNIYGFMLTEMWAQAIIALDPSKKVEWTARLTATQSKVVANLRKWQRS